MSSKVLHVLSQRPSRTGSGITLDAIVRLAEKSGWKQAVVIGIPSSQTNAAVGLLSSSDIHPVRFLDGSSATPPADLGFPVPGMSDVMPYPSTVWSTMNPVQLAEYRQVWTRVLEKVIQDFQPDLIHSNHIWLVSSLLKKLAPNVPVVTTCHATGIRQLELCPHLAAEVISGCRRNDHFFVLHRNHQALLAKTLQVPEHRISVTGVGFRDEIFHSVESDQADPRQDLLYVGKFSQAKGLPWLLDAFSELSSQQPGLRLHIAGDGTGPEAEALRKRMQAMNPGVIMHGMLDQEKLAHLMRQCRVCVLPSFYEGVPLVLVEAAACGCNLVSTQLPGVLEQIAPVVGTNLELVPLPRLHKVDQPNVDDLPHFIENLVLAMQKSLKATKDPIPDLNSFTWFTVFQKVEFIWQSITS